MARAPGADDKASTIAAAAARASRPGSGWIESSTRRQYRSGRRGSVATILNSVRLLTANLYNGRARVAALDRLLDEVEPDVFVGQEVGVDAAAALRARFPHGQVIGSDDYTGRAFLARFEVAVTDLPLPFRLGYRAIVDLDGRPVEVLAVHIANPIDGVSAAGHRRRQLAAIQELVEGPEACVVVGDMNSTPLWPFHRRLSQGLEDAIAAWARASGSRAPRTWGPTPGAPGLLRIDHVFCRGVEVVDHRVHRVAGSDHRAVEVELRAP